MHARSALLLVLGLSSLAHAQCDWSYTHLLAPSRIRSNYVQPPYYLFGGPPGFGLRGAINPWIEVDLLPDNEGHPPAINELRVFLQYPSPGTLRILARLTPGSPWAILRESSADYIVHMAPPVLRIGSLRFEFVGSPSAAFTSFASIDVLGAATDVSLRPTAVPWYGEAASSPIYGTYSGLTLRSCWRSTGIDLGRMFASVPPLSATPFGLPSWIGGFLLDPSLYFVMEDRVLGGGTTWDFSMAGVLEPAFHGAELSFQAVLVDLQPIGDPLLIWTNPVIVQF